MHALVASAALVSGCATSPTPARLPQATSPHGMTLNLTLTTGRTARGELIAVTDTSWYLLINGRVGSMRPSVITSLSLVPKRGLVHVITFPRGTGPDAKWVEEARQVARFPYGMSADVLGALLARTSQTAPDDLGAPPP